MEDLATGGTATTGRSGAAEGPTPSAGATRYGGIFSNFQSVFDIKLLVGPAGIALLAGLLHFLGGTAMRGKVSALGTYHLAPPSTQQDFVFAGLQVMAQIALGGAVMFAIGVVRNLQDPATMAFNWRSDAR